MDSNIEIDAINPCEQSAQLDAPHKSDMPIDVIQKSSIQIDIPHKSSVHIDGPHESSIQFDEPHKSSSQIDVPHESDVQVDVLHESDVQVDVPPESDIQVDVPLESDFQVDVPPESDIQVDVLPESDIQVDVLPESDIQLNVLPESDVQVDVLPESDVQVDVPPESDIQVDVPRESNMQVDVPLESDIQLEIPCDLNTRDGIPDLNTKDDIVCEPSTSLSSGNKVIAQSLQNTQSLDSDMMSLDSDFVTDQDLKSSFSDTEASLTHMEFDISKGEYFFDTDHPALKANSDYRKCLFTLIVLEAKRAKAIKDLEKFRSIKEQALKDPISFIDKLQRGVDLGIPNRITIPEIPEIDWSKYTITPSETTFEKRQLTRQSTKIMSDILSPAKLDLDDDKAKVLNEQQKLSKGGHQSSQPWTSEEQKKLEELLVQFPPEEIESRRWEKIANKLENRTPIQVASRVQKYFIKLMKAGMPIPGRQPNSCYNRKPRRQVVRQQPSTFFTSYFPPLYTTDDEDDDNTYCGNSQSNNQLESSSTDDSDEEISPELKCTEEYKEFLSVKKALREKKRSMGLAQHVGFKCGRCECEPIIGTRWHCLECNPSVDFCGDCVDCLHEFDSHTTDHQLEIVEHAIATSLNRDYTFLPGNNLNYLDPNYGF